MADGRPRPLKDLAAAISFLTILPVRSEWADGETPRATGWYPWVGWILGGLAVLGVNWGISLVDHPPVATGAILLGALVLGGWAALTRFLHWDGLADTFDGVLGGDTPERRLEIMRDSRVGAFGVSAMIFLAFIQFAAVTDAISDRACSRWRRCADASRPPPRRGTSRRRAPTASPRRPPSVAVGSTSAWWRARR
jgi:adenosylcobinamide-GDP ribazoletransferase